MTKNYDGADDEDDQHHGHLLESFSLLPEELGPISLIVSNTINLQKIIFDNDGDGDDDDDDVEGDKNTDGDQDVDANDFLYKHAFYKFVLSVRTDLSMRSHGQILIRGQMWSSPDVQSMWATKKEILT